ncbi:Nitrite transporter NirC [Corynebacterium occultum]|uniref:Nitrite transporter NirC n=1 Tax=Corynebacterium occultum TaxID=2675219 RepID=A0A6B8W3C1_9CORY|nr:formate/nitrite transporter family protein [Corynebacterium occultum]QGU06437.1 Nitrite transporter NirC [Corynebacterium occultum]
MSLNDTVSKAIDKKVDLYSHDFWRFAVRSILAGVYLTIGTAMAAAVGNAVENLAPGLGSIVFGLLFFVGLFTIILLGAELATGNMMYLVYGAIRKDLSWFSAARILLVTTLFNLVGAVMVGFLLGQAKVFAVVDPGHLLSILSQGKLLKEPGQMFIEAVLANFVVNMGIVGATLIKEWSGKFLMLMVVIGAFVILGLEHLIANFSLFSLTFFSADPLIPEMNAAQVSLNWVLVFFGNILGGGFLMGGVYAWLNKGRESYRD